MHKDLIDDRFGRFREIPLVLSRLGHQVTGLCLSYRPKTEGWFGDENVRWQSINAGRLNGLGLVRFMATAASCAQNADIIWACSDSFYGIIGQWIARQKRIPLVFDLYDNFEFFLMAKLPVIKQLYRRAVRQADAITCISDPLKNLIKSYGRKKHVFVLSNAVRADLFRPMDQASCRKSLNLPVGSKIIGTAGALTRNRGFQNLLAAFYHLESRYPDLHLALAGPRNVKISHHSKIHDLGILSLENVPRLLNALDVAVICNKDNKFGRYCYPQKAAEIMACNVPMVSARLGSMAELFKNNPAWLFQPDNSTDLANVIAYRLQHRNTDYASVPTWREMAKNLESIFLDILSHGPLSHPN
jgi:glycosyltransferase involved in cell wall biosynthesis